jgi:hypothetical protein
MSTHSHTDRVSSLQQKKYVEFLGSGTLRLSGVCLRLEFVSRGGASSSQLWLGGKDVKLDCDEGHNNKNRQRKTQQNETQSQQNLTGPVSIDVCWGRTFVSAFWISLSLLAC